jgi:hypothetical protein
VDSPNIGAVSPCLGFWFLNPSAYQVHSRDDRESMSLFFCLGIVKPLSLRSALLLSYMLGLNCLFLCVSMFLLFFHFFFLKKMGGWGGESYRYFFLYLAFQICYVFLPDVSILGEKFKLTSKINKCVCAQSVNKIISMRNLKDTRIFINKVETQYEKNHSGAA